MSEPSDYEKLLVWADSIDDSAADWGGVGDVQEAATAESALLRRAAVALRENVLFQESLVFYSDRRNWEKQFSLRGRFRHWKAKRSQR